MWIIFQHCRSKTITKLVIRSCQTTGHWRQTMSMCINMVLYQDLRSLIHNFIEIKAIYIYIWHSHSDVILIVLHFKFCAPWDSLTAGRVALSSIQGTRNRLRASYLSAPLQLPETSTRRLNISEELEFLYRSVWNGRLVPCRSHTSCYSTVNTSRASRQRETRTRLSFWKRDTDQYRESK